MTTLSPTQVDINIQWLGKLTTDQLCVVTDMMTNENHHLDNIREFADKFGFEHLTNGDYDTWCELLDVCDEQELWKDDNFTTWIELAKYHPEGAMWAFVEEWGIENISEFEDAYRGHFPSTDAFVDELISENGTTIPGFVSVDYDETWRQLGLAGYTETSGYIFYAYF